MKISNKEVFIKTYEECLGVSIREHPEMYAYSIDKIPKVIQRIKGSLEDFSFNHEGLAFKLACSKLNIVHSRKSIIDYLQQ